MPMGCVAFFNTIEKWIRMAASKQNRKEGCANLREWIADLEEIGELKSIKTEVDWLHEYRLQETFY